MIYFDHNATAPLDPVAKAAWIEAQEKSWFNPSSPYRSAAQVRNRLNAAREQLAEWLNRPPEWVCFCSGATEANNTVFASAARVLDPSVKVALSPLEHPSVSAPARRAFAERSLWLPMAANGLVDLAALPDWLDAHKPALVSLQAANNEVGLIQPLRELTELCRARGIWVHSDAVQWAGRYPLESLPAVHALTLSGHKFGAPKGVGVLVIDPALSPGLLWGGGQEEGRRSGTENYPAIAAMLAVLEARQGSRLSKLQSEAPQAVIEAARRLWGERFHCPGRDGGAAVLWNTLALTPPRHAAHRWIHQFERRGFLIASGAACSTAAQKASSTLKLLGLSDAEAKRTIRMSAGWETTLEDWQGLAEALADCWQALERDAQSDANGLGTVIEID